MLMQQKTVKSGWSVGGKLQRENTSKTLSLQCHFASPETYTIQFNVIGPAVSTAVNVSSRKIQAEIDWSVAGNVIRRVISVGEGTSISGNAEAVRVVLRDVTAYNGVNHDTTEYTVSVTVVKGVRGSALIPPILDVGSTVSVAAGTVETIDVPQGKGINGFYASIEAVDDTDEVVALPAGLCICTQKQNSASPPLFSSDPQLFQWIPLVPGATILRFNNASDDLLFAVFVLWSIDG